MRAVFDTNILIDYLNGIEAAEKEIFLHQARAISVITQMEVLVGARTQQEEKAIRGFLTLFETIELSAKIAEQTVQIRRENRLKLPDAIIYATARVQGCNLVTRNIKDFDAALPDIRIPYNI